MNLILLGLRGSGKTTVGGLLARQLQRSFTDLDSVTLSIMGCATVKEAWQQGQPAFRRAEASALSRVLGRSQEIIALGGGTPTAPGATDMLRTSQAAGASVLVYLAADADTLRARLAGGTDDRPALTSSDPLAEIESVLSARDPLYRDLADHVVDADQTPAQVAEEIAGLLGA